VKTALDRSSAFILLVLLSPLLGCVALLVGAFLGRPILFRKARPGLHGRPFTLLKFRTMRMPDGDTEGLSDSRKVVLTDQARLGAFGRLLRRTSLDELPQLINILRGDMSFVGPRPLLTEYLPLYSPEQARRHEVRPGLTGWAQVNGRNALGWEDKFALDVWYVEHQSLALDARILARTVRQLFAGLVHGAGVSQTGQATALPFEGAGERTAVSGSTDQGAHA
jgi:sugar transferase EpsL